MVHSKLSISMGLILFASVFIVLSGCESREAKMRISEEMMHVNIKFEEVKAANAEKWAPVGYRETAKKREVLLGLAKAGMYIEANAKLESYYVLADQTIESAASARAVADHEALAKVTAVLNEKKEILSKLGPYVVKKGDWLYKIARQMYGDQAKWKNIYDHNKTRIKNPNQLSPGLTICLPD